MNDLDKFFTPRILELKTKAEELLPSAPITFTQMTDSRLIKHSAGAAVTTKHNGEAIVQVDASRADEVMVAHELMHVILHRSGWPELLCIVANEVDNYSQRLADDLDNILDHQVFNPKLDNLGFDREPYNEWFMKQIINWPQMEEPKGANKLFNTLHILEGLCLGSTYRARIIKLVSDKGYRKVLKLAYKLEEFIPKGNQLTKENVRSSAISILDTIGKMISREVGYDVNIRQRIGATPLLNEEQLNLQASSILDFVSIPKFFDNRIYWWASFRLKADNTFIFGYTVPNAPFEIPEIKAIRAKWEEMKLEELLNSENIKFSTI